MELTEVERERLAKLENLRQAGIDPYPPRAQFIADRVMAADAIKHALATNDSSLVTRESSKVTNHDSLSIAVMGRIVAKRVMGRASFVGVEDGSGRIQFFA